MQPYLTGEVWGYQGQGFQAAGAQAQCGASETVPLSTRGTKPLRIHVPKMDNICSRFASRPFFEEDWR